MMDGTGTDAEALTGWKLSESLLESKRDQVVKDAASSSFNSRG